MNRLGDWLFALAAVLLAACYGVVYWRAALSPLEFDEAYNLQVVASLARGWGYASFGAMQGTEGFLFDPYISTGPVVVLPGVLPWLAGGGYSWLVRVVPLGYFTLLLGVLFGFTRQFWGRWTGLAVTATPLLLNVGQPDLITSGLVPGRFIGEFAALGLLLAAAWAAANSRIALAGLLAGLSCQAKSVFVLGGAILLVAWWVADWLGCRRPDWWAGVRGAGAAIAPTLAFECYRLIGLGSWRAYRENLDLLGRFLASQRNPPQFRPERLGALAELFTTPGMLVLVGALMIGVLAALWPPPVRTGARRARRAGGSAAVCGHDRARMAVVCWAGLLGFGFVLLYLWIWQASQGSHRQALPFLLIAYPLAVLVACVVAERAWPHLAGRLKPLIVVLVLLAGLAQGLRAWQYRGAEQALTEQQQAARVVERSGTESLAIYRGWFQLPEYQLLTGIPHDRTPGVAGPRVDVYTDLMALVILADEGHDARSFLPRCRGRRVLFQSATVVVCERA